MGCGGVGVGFFGAMLSCVGFCENPNILVISNINTNTNLLAILPILAVKVVKIWERWAEKV